MLFLRGLYVFYFIILAFTGLCGLCQMINDFMFLLDNSESTGERIGHLFSGLFFGFAGIFCFVIIIHACLE